MLNTNINNRVTLFETPLGLIFLIIMSLANWRIISAWSVNKILMTGPKMNEFGANATTYLMFSDIVASGEKKAAAECRYQFRLDRWNCPEESIMTQKSRLSATQEASFVQSILAAGIMHTLTRRCSLGHFSDCGCDDSKKGKRGGHNWLWSGCSDDVRFSARVSKQLIDSLEKGKDALASMKLHNNEVGRMAVRKTMKTICKCHGVSGSCTTKTCWRQLANFRRVGYYLKKRYFKSLHVNFQEGKLGEWNVASGQGLSLVSKTDLVYLEKSPDYCKQNVSLAIKGTLNRECKRPNKSEKISKWERRSCQRLCLSCGYRIKHWTEEVLVSCHCKFLWCCAVKCRKCLEKTDKYSCRK
ncbi:protein Wnt-8b-like isoform X2 [Octopus sinensis]|uniref:Protein Wnt n=1 Tax=Octopus sinensis TaxID=2607531 RepID=A0A7E6ENV2_9MOLL|nr:protein Wnt-8b-like isoform X2 [Octopus sinensis]